jgi:hypothetical protein
VFKALPAPAKPAMTVTMASAFAAMFLVHAVQPFM